MRLEGFEVARQAAAGQFAEMAAQQAALGGVENGGGQGDRADLLAKLPAVVEQQVVQAQVLALEEMAHGLGALALVGEEEHHVGILRLSLLQHRHLAPTRRAPTGPEVDHQRAAPEIGQLHRLAGGVAQAQFGQARTALVDAQAQAAKQPERQPEAGADTQRAT